MFDPQKLLEQFLGGAKTDSNTETGGHGSAGMSADFMKGLAAGGAAGGLAGILMGGKTSKKLVKGAVKVGGTAALAGLAYKAYTQWQASKAGVSGGEQTPMTDITPRAEMAQLPPAAREPRNETALAILRAMIAAAKADGRIDADEQGRIFAKLDEMDLGVAEKAFVIDELRKPLDIESVVKAATTPEMAVEIYAASFLAIEPDDPAELAYLAMLAARLKLDPGLKAVIETEARKTVA